MNFNQKNILVADENPYIRASLPKVLSNHFNNVGTCEHAEELLSVLANNNYDVLLLDMTCLRSPDTGIYDDETLKKILQVNPSLVIILMTRAEVVDQALKLNESGAADFILKPYTPAKLIKNIKQLLYIQNLENELINLKRQIKKYAKKEKNESLNLNEKEKECIIKALFAYQGNMTHAARQLGITRATLYTKIKKYGIS